MNQRHALTQVDREARTAVCSVCGPTSVKPKARGAVQCATKRAEERQKYRPATPRPKRTTRRVLAASCVRCGFVPEDPCQLEVDHVIPKWKGGTDRQDNLQTLCCNCHALKTKRDKEEWKASPAGQAWLMKVKSQVAPTM